MRLKVLTISLLLLVFGCGKKQEIACIVGNQDVIVGGESGQELSPTQVFRKNNGTEPGTLDPHRTEGVPASNVLRDLFEGLVMEDPSGAYIPGAAESWSLSEDAKTYVFKMRENGKWSNGDVVTAEDFVYGLRRSVDPATLSNYSSMLYPIKNARDIVLGKKSPETLGVRANGPTTLIIELDEPTPYFLSLLTHATTYAAHRPSVEEFGARFTRPGNLVGNGAFKLEEWRVQSHIKLVRNTEYWDNKNTTLEEVYYYPLDDVNSSFKRYRAQELDFTETVLAEQLPWIRQCLPGDLKISPYFGSYYYGFNNTRPPFKNKPKLRTALSMAVDRNVIADIILGAGQIPAYSLVPSVKTFKAVPANWSQWTQEQRNQEEFFHTFNVLLESNKQIIITSDRYPKEIRGLEERLKSRFGWGLTVCIDPPELETCVAILKVKSSIEGFDLPEDVAFFIANKIRSNVRELEGALRKLMANCKFTNRKASVEIAKESLRDLLAIQAKQITIENIQKIVAEYYNIRISDLLSKRRNRSITRPRQLAMAITRELTSHSLPEIGDSFGGRDHTTVLHACKKTIDFKNNDNKIKEDYENIIRSLNL